jgi:hypothetical protein
VDNATGEFELYDLAEDIGEQRNLAEDRAGVRQELVSAYEEWNAQNVDALWVRQSFGREGRGQGRGGGRNLQRRFSQFDRNGDGTLSAEEVGNQNLFRRMDADGDGSVTLEEARSGLGGRRRRQAQ